MQTQKGLAHRGANLRPRESRLSGDHQSFGITARGPKELIGLGLEWGNFCRVACLALAAAERR
jgi:hypothetical protein